MKNLNQQMGFVTYFLNEASQEIKVQLMKVDYWNSTKLNNRKKIQPRILLKRTLKKTRNLMNSETFWQNKKRKKILKFKELCFQDTLSDKLPANCAKNLQHFIFSIPFFLISFV